MRTHQVYWSRWYPGLGETNTESETIRTSPGIFQPVNQSPFKICDFRAEPEDGFFSVSALTFRKPSLGNHASEFLWQKNPFSSTLLWYPRSIGLAMRVSVTMYNWQIYGKTHTQTQKKNKLRTTPHVRCTVNNITVSLVIKPLWNSSVASYVQSYQHRVVKQIFVAKSPSQVHVSYTTGPKQRSRCCFNTTTDWRQLIGKTLI